MSERLVEIAGKGRIRDGLGDYLYVAGLSTRPEAKDESTPGTEPRQPEVPGDRETE